MTAETLLTLKASGVLAHALVGHVARETGARALSIKGPFAAAFGLRDQRVSADADILVEPAKIELVCAELDRRGWHPRAGRTPPTFIDMHSVTLIHDAWPCDLDVHRYFPGFLASPEVVFDLLWQGREIHRAAGGEVATPSRAGMAAIVALHAVRTPDLAKSRRDLVTVRESISTRFTRAEVDDFCAIVAAGRAQWVLRDLIDEVGLPLTEDDATPAEKRLWEKNQQPALTKAASLWLREVADAPMLQKPGAIIHALWVPREHIPRNDPQRVPTWRESWAFQRSRWLRGIRALADYLGR
ncbi:hypothetical protein ACYX8G_15415 [Microbacterium saperdae]